MKSKQLRIRTHEFLWGSRTYIMGIVNVTPDSFSKDGVLQQDCGWVACAVEQARHMESEGADIIDIGGESTRPGNTALDEAEELRRVIPVITALRAQTNIPISIDTYKAAVAEAALSAGADIINDVWGLMKDERMATVAATYGAPVIIMHNRAARAEHDGSLGGRFVGTAYEDMVKNITDELHTSLLRAHAAGVRDEHIILDPGIGFGKTVAHNLELVRRFREFTELGYPTLVGPSRKSFVGYTLNLAPEDRLEGTAAAVSLLIDRGADIIRVHDVREMKRVAALTDAVTRLLRTH